MLHLLAVIAPLALSAAVSPMMFSEQVLLVGGSHGRRNGALFAAGAVVVTVVVVVLVSVVGHSLRMPTAPHLDAATDMVVGSLLLVTGAVVAFRRRPSSPPSSPRLPHGPMSPLQALGFGIFSMATNFTTLAIVVVATKDVSASGLPVAERLPPLVVLVVLATVPAWLPPVLAAWPGGRVARTLGAVADAATRHSRQILVAVLLGVGLYLVVRGAVKTLGL